ncbi:2OG-Fe(II) oxygenase [Dyadobacter sp. CY261]|uniref:2OG-Fe(II) oxygenase n=1 Tax=Dyadobacter sp. CY261 TaxID=2907203 RepID=UPI001F160ADA|nr:2OG-Fe(II) oxygenase [Dyadobacter sp. CY261]MCF0075198.1 2OG-Fe(II) oxygenase [Dyadobacter sp. CY261]
MTKRIIPVALFVYNRRDTVETLLDCLKSEGIPLLYVFSDGPKDDLDQIKVDQVREVISAIDWCEVVVFERPVNFGLGRSQIQGISEVLSRHYAALIFEDDLFFVKGTYSYLVSALEFYENAPEVMSVTGWTHPLITPKNLHGNPYFDGKSECWGWGTWSRAWKGMERSALEIYSECLSRGIDVEKYGSDMPKMALEAADKNLWAVRWWYLHMLNDGLCLRPPHTLIETSGFDGRGTTVNPTMAIWRNPQLTDCPSIPEHYPEPIENIDCKKLWRNAVDRTPVKYSGVYSPKGYELGTGIWQFQNFLMEVETEYLLAMALRNGFDGARNGQHNGRYNLAVFIRDDEMLQLLRSRLLLTLETLNVSFQKAETTETLEFYSYQTGHFVRTHSDKPAQVGRDLYTNYKILIYLNSDFEGGSTYFDTLDLKVNPGKGGAIIFNTDLSHSGLEVLRGAKYILCLRFRSGIL